MASVMSASPSISSYEYQADSTGDPDENLWTLVNQPAGSTASSTGAFSFSPAPGSLNSWAVVNGRQIQHSPQQALSPLDFSSPSFPSSNYGEVSSGPFNVTSAQLEGQFLSSSIPGEQAYLTPADMLFNNGAFESVSYNPDLDISALLGSMVPEPFQSGPDVPPWNPAGLQTPSGDPLMFAMEDPSLISPSPPQYLQEPSISPPASASPQSPFANIKMESVGSTSIVANRKRLSAATSNPIVISSKVRGAARVEKPSKKAKASLSDSASKSAASGSSSSGMSQFLIVTPDSVHAHANQPNPFECFAAARPSHKGRKGPLADDTKHNALQVRRLGACFCCHARKVRCDKERPCRNCTKLMVQVPQVICWQFQDFLPVLFPTFVRSHFQKQEMAKFLSENIADFTVGGAAKPCVVEVFSGAQFNTTLQLKAKYFTPKTADVLQHWHMQVLRNSIVDIQAREAPPIGLDIDGPGTGAQRDELRKKVREYIASIIKEPRYAEQMTDSLRHTDIPRRVLKMVQRYADRTSHAMVQKALSIYAMHYVMTRHLCLTQHTVASLRLPPSTDNNPWVTLRVLNRQVKSVIDELLMREMQALFDAFSKSLKPKLRREWAPCLAAFLVLCLFMESLETAADTFVMGHNEIDLRGRGAATYRRAFALDINREVENLPFRQFAFQFHQIYATHSRDASARGFNPLVDDVSLRLAELDRPAAELVLGLKGMIDSDWHELDYLCADDILPNDEAYTYPRDVASNYTGRLVAKFLLSFTDERYIFGLS